MRRAGITPRRTCCTRRCGRCSALTSSRPAHSSRPNRLRFDFVHFQPVTREEVLQVERIVNEQIVRNTAVETEVRSTDEAIAAGAMALFGEKYGDRVRVVSIPGFSLELCGGTHVRATGDIGLFTIVAESGVAAGVRRIEALTGLAAVEAVQHQRASLGRLIEALHVGEDHAIEAVDKLQAEAKRLGREVISAQDKARHGRYWRRRTRI